MNDASHIPHSLAIKVDVDTYHGTQQGVPALCALFQRHNIPATFYFSLGPDNTGKCIRRLLKPGFFRKVSRTNVIELYGIRTLLYGTLLKAPIIGEQCKDILKKVRDSGFEVGIHCYDHFEWQEYLHTMDASAIEELFMQARSTFKDIFGTDAKTAAAPGWQSNAHSLQSYDNAELIYASDCRGYGPFFPTLDGKQFRTLQIPTNLPTLDELLGRPEYPEGTINNHYFNLLQKEYTNIHTIHAEIEGMKKLHILDSFITECKKRGVLFVQLEKYANQLLEHSESIPFCSVEQRAVDGRSGLLACKH